MALSDPEINLLRLKSRDPFDFARAIEAEVRKQDDALILQLLDALEKIDAAMPFPVAKKAIAAGRARLGGKSCPKE